MIAPAPEVLVVEDQFDLLTLLLELFTQAGYRAEGVSTGKEALARLEQKPPDLLLTDVVLPDTDGLELTRKLKSAPGTKHIPVVLVSGEPASRLTPDAVTATGADAFLPKPLALPALEQTVAALLSGRRAPGQPPAPGPPGSP